MALTEFGAEPVGGSADTIRRGVGTKQANVVELRIIKGYYRKPREEWLSEIWFGRARYLVMAHHDYGTFDRLQVHDMKEELNAWEENEANQETLQRTDILLSRLREIVRTTETKTCVVICKRAVKPPVLRIHASTSGEGPLPASVVRKFWNIRESWIFLSLYCYSSYISPEIA